LKLEKSKPDDLVKSRGIYIRDRMGVRPDASILPAAQKIEACATTPQMDFLRTHQERLLLAGIDYKNGDSVSMRKDALAKKRRLSS
jgi:hypothetical protein